MTEFPPAVNNRMTPIADITAVIADTAARAKAGASPAMPRGSAFDGEKAMPWAPKNVCEGGTKEQGPAARYMELWPSMARLAIACKEAPEYRLYVALWNQYKTTGGWALAANVINGDYGRNLGLKPARLRQLINRGVGRYWNLSGGLILLINMRALNYRLQQQAKAAGIAGYDEPARRKMLIASDSLESLETFQAACLNAWISERKGRSLQITWAKLCPLWNRSRRNLYDWFRLAGVEVAENYGRRWLGVHKRGQRHIFDLVFDEASGNPQVIADQGGQLWAYFQRGNTYTGNALHGNRGACKAINAHSGNYIGDWPEDDSGQHAEQWATDRARANFASIDALLRRKKKGREIAENAYVFQPKRSNQQRRLWSLDH